MSPTTKSREFILSQGKGRFTTWSGAKKAWVVTGEPEILIMGRQTTVSEGHPISLLGKTVRDLGGGFFSQCNSYSGSSSYGSFANSKTNPTIRYEGPQTAYITELAGGSASWPDPQNDTTAELAVAGAQAIARTLPTNPTSNVTNMLGELKRDGIPSLVGLQTLRSRGNILRSAGSEYLNVQFGWKPFVNDLRKLADSVINSERILSQYHRDNNRIVRRGFSFPPESEEIMGSPITGVRPKPTLSSAFFDSPVGGTLIESNKTTAEKWFSGAFIYHIPTGNDLMSRMTRYAMEANKLYGVLTPETVWNLTPWTWAVDWFVDVGDVVHNASVMSTTGTTLSYAYVMQTVTQERTYSLTGVRYKTGGPSSFSQTFKSTSKVRVKGSPFGFGLTYDGFSNYQWSILGALGLSRGARVL